MTHRTLNPYGESRFFPNFVALVVQTVFATLLTLLQVKILSNFLSREAFGLFASLRGFSLLLAMLAANGLPHLLVRYLPVHESAGERSRAVHLSAVCLVVSTAILTLLGLLAYGLRSQLFAFVDGQSVSDDLLVWLALTTLGVVLKQILYGGLQGLRRMTFQVFIELGSLSAALIWMFIARNDLTLSLLFRILGVVHITSLCVGIPMFFLLVRDSPIQHGTRETQSYGPAYRDYLPWAVGISLVATAFTDVDRYLIAQVLPLELLALFHIASRVTRSANRLLASSNTAIQPEVTRLHAEGRGSDAQTLARVFLKVSLAVGMLVAFAVSVFAREIILLIASESYTPAVPLVVLLAACIPLTTATAPLTTVMRATDQVREALRTDLVWALVYIGFILFLGPLLGLIGIGLATLAACLAQLAFAVKTSELSVSRRFVGGLLLKPLASISAGLVPLLLVWALLGSQSTWLFFSVKVVLFVLGCGIYLAMARRLRMFGHDEREKLLGFLEARGLGGLIRLL
jgi:O-antigen/teichoic acid export membrane protein